MDKYNTLCSLVNQANLLIEQMDLNTVFDNLRQNISTLEGKNAELVDQVEELEKRISELNFKYNKDTEILSNELKAKQEELANLTKVSYIQSLNKQLVEKTNYCQILESQLDKLKREQPVQQNPVIGKLAKKAAEAEAELKLQKEESEKAKLNVGKKSKKVIEEEPDVKLVLEPEPVVLAEVEPDNVAEPNVELVLKEPVLAEEEHVETNESIKPKKSKKSKKIIDEEPPLAEEEPVLAEEEPIVEEESIKPKKSKKSKKVIDEEPPLAEEEPVLAEVEPLPEVEPVLEEESIKPKKSKKSKKVIEEEPVLEIEPVLEEESIKPKKSKKSKKVIDEEPPLAEVEPEQFNVDNWEDINGYELIMYKSDYYLRDLETSEIYNIVSNGPGQIVGLMNGKGKVKLN